MTGTGVVEIAINVSTFTTCPRQFGLALQIGACQGYRGAKTDALLWSHHARCTLRPRTRISRCFIAHEALRHSHTPWLHLTASSARQTFRLH